MKISLNTGHAAPTLLASRIYLRPIIKTDYSAIKLYRQDAENCRYIRPAESDTKIMEIVEQLSQPWHLAIGRWNALAICLQDDNSLVGEIAFRIEDWDNQRGEIGYRLSAEVAGQGLCSEAANLLISYLFQTLGFFKLIARCDPRNIASFRIMEKLGFVREAFFKQHYLMGDEWADQYDYGLLASEWSVK
ncbi:GNAT family N-acetyltransferase [Colwellia sp. M166]|uniref:GNAT family N-acetyltransferase n=1 Tax=Colwellia sp. M166 TaxID=2583805 RepID=UPI00211E8D00|nr:GNAT family protein [Colwellia sp. M166]UUO25179.1 GNAT family N-acetyltransferase [Colwellia sp. M166]|tara:strand:+ start:331 stop:900 length:570 start_codon:yes stop_codon:yes gene_type:complete